MNTNNEKLFFDYYVRNINSIEQRNRQIMTECYFYLTGIQYGLRLNTNASIENLYKDIKYTFELLIPKYRAPIS